MDNDYNSLQNHLNDLKSAKQKIRQQELEHSLKFVEEVSELLKRADNSEYEEDAERVLKSYNQTIELTGKLSVKIDKWITDLENQLKSSE